MANLSPFSDTHQSFHAQGASALVALAQNCRLLGNVEAAERFDECARLVREAAAQQPRVIVAEGGAR